MFNSYGFKVVVPKSEPTNNIGIDADKSSGHGGELVAFKSNYKYKRIDQHILDAIHATTNAPLRFAAAIMEFKGTFFVLLFTYGTLKDSLRETKACCYKVTYSCKLHNYISFGMEILI